MSLFDKFKKKKEHKTQVAPDTEAVKVEEKTEEAVSNNETDFLTISSDSFLGEKSSAYELWSIYQKESGKNDSYNPLEYIEQEIKTAMESSSNESTERTGTEFTNFLRELQRYCSEIYKKIQTEKKAAEKSSGKQLSVSPVNAEPFLFMTRSKLRLWCVLVPPLYGGEEISDEKLKFRMDSMGIKYGIDTSMTKKIISEKMYMKIVQLALGKEAVHGKSGVCKNLFSKVSHHVNIKEDFRGNVNYKELNMFQSVHKGDTICEITLPTESFDGVTVTGETIVAREGKYPLVPAGKNTEFNDDKTLLVAKVDGELIFEDNKFNVRNLLTIENDVDNAVGNIDFAGDVLIKGGVREGYTVKAEGDVRITGTVEAATIIVGGDLQMDRGMTGGNKGVIDVQGSLKCRYLERCKVYAKEGIEADQIMYSFLSTDKNIVAKGKKGLIAGGRAIAGRTIEAMTIGTHANTTLKTEIVIGVVPRLIEREKELKHELETIQGNMHKMSQDITYINKNIEKASEERKKVLINLVSEYQIEQLKCKKTEDELKKVSARIQENWENCGLKSDNVFPIISFNVCGMNYVLNKEIIECRIVRKENKTYIMGSNLQEMIAF